VKEEELTNEISVNPRRCNVHFGAPPCASQRGWTYGDDAQGSNPRI